MPTSSPQRIRTIDMLAIDEVFAMGGGYVLNFSNRTFSEFFAEELGVDIDQPRWSVNGGSKAKRLRTYLRQANRETALRTLQALWEYRQSSSLVVEHPPIGEGGRTTFFQIIERLGGAPPASMTPDTDRATQRPDADMADDLAARLLTISGMDPQRRGYEFEKFLKDLFDAFGLAARASFRLRGEQIDGSFSLGQETYLLEAKWTNSQVDAATLRSFNAKVEDKARWSRGLMVSQSGFTTQGLEAFGRGKSVVCMNGLDLHETLTRSLDLSTVIAAKVRRAAETGMPFVPVRDLDLERRPSGGYLAEGVLLRPSTVLGADEHRRRSWVRGPRRPATLFGEDARRGSARVSDGSLVDLRTRPVGDALVASRVSL